MSGEGKTEKNMPMRSINGEWLKLIDYCQRLGFGEIEKLKIQNGVPVIADIVRERVKFN